MTVYTRSLALSEVETLVGWAKAEGWNPGLADAPAFYAADPQGFIGCFVNGEMVAGISAVAYGDDFGFIGLYICHPDHRGKGYGRRVWDAGMAHLAGRTIGLDGVPEQQQNYASMGFVRSYTTHRWSGRLQGDAARPAGIVDISPALLPAVLAYDRPSFPAPRNEFLAGWIAEPRLCKILLRNGIVCGYGVIRACHDDFKVGPLFADRLEDAKMILTALSNASGGKILHLDIPEGMGAFSSWLEAQTFTRGFKTARMYKGKEPVMDDTKVFAVTTLELG